MRSATTKRSSAGFVAFMLGTFGTLVLVIAVIALFGGNSKTPFVPAAPASGTPAAGAAGGGGSDAPAPAGDNAINVVEKDFAIAMDKTTIKAGSITFNIKNSGPSPHNIAVKELNKVSENVDAGKTATLAVDLKPGTYTVICQIPGHEQLGMKMTLTVQ